MATGLDLAGLIQAAQLGRSLNPEVMQQQALGNQLAQQLQQLQIAKLIRDEQDFNNPQARNMRALQATLAGKVSDPLSGITFTEGGVADVGPTLPNPTDLLDPNVRPESLRSTPIELLLGPGGQPTGFQFDAQRARTLEDIINPPKATAYAPGSYVATPEQLRTQTGFTVPDKASAALKLPHIDRGNSIDFVDPLTNKVISSFPKNKDTRFEIRNEGVWVEQTPGKGDFKLQGNAPTGTSANEQLQLDSLERSITSIDDLIERANDNTTGRAARLQGSKFFPAVAQTDEFVDYGADLDALKSQVFLTQISLMKQDSKTGAAGLGPVSNREGQRLEDAYASLRQDQSKENVKKNLGIAKDAMTKYWNEKKKFLSRSSQPLPTGGKKTLSSPINFPSEEAARAAGFGNGSTVIINGVYGDLH